jgi:hypothetical protein
VSNPEGLPKGFSSEVRSWGRCANGCGLHDSHAPGGFRAFAGIDHYCILSPKHAGRCEYIATCGRERTNTPFV